ncbi:MAG: hypothetical protein HYU77_04025 [Betaproteobacteria bacterium]|nr:hypothetical protein [Betaproteobacteria bacterium]
MSGQRVIVVLGMHRSGTSAVTRGLQALGIELGDNLIPTAPQENAKGYFEDWDITELNKEVLQAVGLEWSSVGLVPDDKWQGEPLRPLRLKAVETLRRRFGGNRLWGFKDPRTCRVLPFWQGVFEHLGLDDAYVIAVRNPLSVARSLATRDGFAPERSYLLWLEHLVDAITYTRGKPRVVVDYDELIGDPDAQLRRIGRALDLPCDGAGEAGLAEYTEEFLDSALRHSAFFSGDLNLDPNAFELARNGYQLLRQAALDRAPAEEIESLAGNIRAGLYSLAPVCRYLDQVIQTANSFEKRTDIAEQALAATRGELAATRAELEEVSGQLQQVREHAVEMTAALEAKRAEADALEQALAQRDAQLAVLMLERSTFGAQIGRVLTRLRGRLAPAGSLAGKLADWAIGVARALLGKGR